MPMDTSAIVADFAKDTAKENNGAWLTYKRFRYLIARAHRDNIAFQRMMEEEMRPYMPFIARGDYSAMGSAGEAALQAIYAKTVLLGISALDGTPLDYTPDDGVALFKQLPDFWDEVRKFANSTDPYSPAAVADDSKN